LTLAAISITWLFMVRASFMECFSMVRTSFPSTVVNQGKVFPFAILVG
jgi:hypothetical protein